MQPLLGVLLLDTRFPRIPGDIGNEASYPYPIRFRVIRGATVPRVVTRDLDRSLLDPFLEGARELEREGVRAITTSCGFLVLFQDEIARELRVPFFASSLLQIPLVYRMIQRPVGVITANAAALTPDHLRAAGVDASIPVLIGGLEEREAFASAILRDGPELDAMAVEREVVETAWALLERNPEIGAFVCECHNLAPYGPAIQRTTGRPVFDIFSLIALVSQAVAKPVFRGSQQQPQDFCWGAS
ncbi:MAG: aspartate/glutamate racemase family protein [Armatimonadota bacterium]|nr:aspartate/glutamate racemase family protein [Armatimonadota bacterium]MDR5703237.1 aspartate/glutamate racemase family protein [Armatimonadota bacterium]MDR7433823.1 aspartate/glutamate racemase family protein [Armatimonadota bacterium]